MKKRGVLLLGSLIFLLFMTYFVAAPACGGAVPCNCGDNITSSRTLDTTDNITVVAKCENSTTLHFGGNDTVLNCDNRPIIGNNSNTGFNLAKRNNLTIANCTLSNFSTGITAAGGNLTVISNNVLSDISITCLSYTIVNAKDHNVSIVNNSFRNCPTAFSSSAANAPGGFLIAENNFTNTTTNAITDSLRNTLVTRNRFTNSSGTGIFHFSESGTNYTNNNLSGSMTFGIQISSGGTLYITGNRLVGNFTGISTGIETVSSANTVNDNTVINFSTGINFSASDTLDTNEMSRNIIEWSSIVGISFYVSSDGSIYGFTAVGNIIRINSSSAYHIWLDGSFIPNGTDLFSATTTGLPEFINTTLIGIDNGFPSFTIRRLIANITFNNTNMTRNNASIFFPLINYSSESATNVNVTDQSIFVNSSNNNSMLAGRSIFAVNTSVLGLNRPANITVFNVNCSSFNITYNASFITSNETMGTSFGGARTTSTSCGSPAVCSEIVCSSGVLRFNVASWSSYGIGPDTPADAGSSTPAPTGGAVGGGGGGGGSGVPPGAPAPAGSSSGSGTGSSEEGGGPPVDGGGLQSSLPPPVFLAGLGQVWSGDSMVVLNGDVIGDIVLGAFQQHQLSFSVSNLGTDTLHNIRLSLDLPDTVRVVSIDPPEFAFLRPLEEATFSVVVETDDLRKAFSLRVVVDSLETTFEKDLPVVVTPRNWWSRLLDSVPKFLFPVIGLGLLLTLLRLLALNDRIKDFLQNLFQYFYKTNVADEEMIRSLIRERKIKKYFRIYTTNDAYNRYRTIKNLRPLPMMKVADRQNVLSMSRKYSLDLELAWLLHFAAGKNRARFLTAKTLPDALKEDFKTIEFLNPLVLLKKGVEAAKKEVVLVEKEIGYVEQGVKKEEKAFVKFIKNIRQRLKKP